MTPDGSGDPSYLNLVFHDLTTVGADSRDVYSVGADFYESLVERITKCAATLSYRFSRVRVYFDDAHRSVWACAMPLGLVRLCEHVISVPTARIGTEGRLSREQIVELRARGFRIAAHGVTHSPLAIYRDEILQPTPIGGRYQAGRGERSQRLTEREVLYEISESIGKLAKHFGDINEFVLPYGLYNRQTLGIARRISEDLVVSTSDGGFDDGGRLRHRVIVTAEATWEGLVAGPVHPSSIRGQAIRWT